MSRRVALSLLVAIVLVVGLIGLIVVVAATTDWETLDPAPEFSVLIANPCSTSVDFDIRSDIASGVKSKADKAITIPAESATSLLWGLFDGELVVSAPSLTWESRMNVPDRGHQLVFLLEAESCP